MGSRDSAVRALAFHQRDSGSIPARGHTLAEVFVVSRFALRVFLPVLRFSSLHKNLLLQVEFDQGRG